ncbi:MAG: four helix bundle protein [Gemmatimonadota bacterium]
MERFSFRRLNVYREAMLMVKEVGQVVRAIPSDHRDLVWQIRRAARSVLLNIAEGAGEFAPREKARIHRIARRSAWETVAALDLALEERFLRASDLKGVLDRLHAIIGMLTTMGKKAEARVPRPRPRPRPKDRGQ